MVLFVCLFDCLSDCPVSTNRSLMFPDNQTDWGIVAHLVSFSFFLSFFLFFATHILTNFGCLSCQRGLLTIWLTLFSNDICVFVDELSKAPVLHS